MAIQRRTQATIHLDRLERNIARIRQYVQPGAAFMAAAPPVFIGASTGGWLSGRHGPLAIHIKNMRKELIP